MTLIIIIRNKESRNKKAANSLLFYIDKSAL